MALTRPSKEDKRNIRIPDNLRAMLSNSKNLLALSGGADSTALFFILLKHNIDFDVATINYNNNLKRNNTENYIKNISKKYKKKLFFKNLELENRNFEHIAREARYKFFDEIMCSYNYNFLLTAHQLNDRFEWFLMQFSKGAGVNEVLGFNITERKNNYFIVRPLIEIDRTKIVEFLEKNKIRYFDDPTNKNTKHKRNLIREKFATNFVKLYKDGVIKSFQYFNIDKKDIFSTEAYFNKKKLYILKQSHSDNITIRHIDKIVKKMGYLLTNGQRKEIIKTRNCTIANKISICYQNSYIWISPHIKIKLDKQFKERCRVIKIPPKIRGYMKKDDISLERLPKI